MAALRVILAFALVGVTLAFYGHEGHEDYDHHPEYKFEYSVHDPHTHDIKEQHESRHGDMVKGWYKLKEADGTTRTVHYTVDHKNGFTADVQRTCRGPDMHSILSTTTPVRRHSSTTTESNLLSARLQVF